MSEPLLEVRAVDAFYGTGHILQEIGFAVGDESVAIVGRNGMGKTTLCASIMGLMPSLKGTVRG
jgi:branched-chain amino acid transport system ATP-binding protein